MEEEEDDEKEWFDPLSNLGSKNDQLNSNYKLLNFG